MPTPSRMPKVAEVLGVRRAWLQDGEDPMRPVVSRIAERRGGYPDAARREDEFSLSGREFKLLLAYRGLNPRQKDLVQDLVALLAESTPRKRD